MGNPVSQIAQFKDFGCLYAKRQCGRTKNGAAGYRSDQCFDSVRDMYLELLCSWDSAQRERRVERHFRVERHDLQIDGLHILLGRRKFQSLSTTHQIPLGHQVVRSPIHHMLFRPLKHGSIHFCHDDIRWRRWGRRRGPLMPLLGWPSSHFG